MTVTSRAGTAPVELPAGALKQLRDGTWDATRSLLEAKDQIRETAARIPYLSDFRASD